MQRCLLGFIVVMLQGRALQTGAQLHLLLLSVRICADCRRPQATVWVGIPAHGDPCRIG